MGFQTLSSLGVGEGDKGLPGTWSPQRGWEAEPRAHAPLTAARAHSSCAERDDWHGCLSRALPEDYKAQALAAFHHSVEVSAALWPA